MIRTVAVIVVLTTIALTLVHLRREKAQSRYEINCCMTRQIALRRKLWDQRLVLAAMTAPAEVRRRMSEMALGMTDEDHRRRSMAALNTPGGLVQTD